MLLCVFLLFSEMSRLRSCRATVLRQTCGPSAAEVLTKLFDIALQDPHYLRFGYQPDCRLHGADAVPSEPQSNTPDLSSDGYVPLQRKRDHDRQLADSPAVDDRRERVRQTGNGPSTASERQRASLLVFSVTLLPTVAVAYLR